MENLNNNENNIERKKKQPAVSIDAYKNYVHSLLNEDILLTTFVGKKEKQFEGKIVGEFASVFLFETVVNGRICKSSYSFVDLFTHRILIKKNII